MSMAPGVTNTRNRRIDDSSWKPLGGWKKFEANKCKKCYEAYQVAVGKGVINISKYILNTCKEYMFAVS